MQVRDCPIADYPLQAYMIRRNPSGVDRRRFARGRARRGTPRYSSTVPGSPATIRAVSTLIPAQF